MPIIVVADHAHINGGQAKVALDSALGLAARGTRVTLFAACGPADPRLAAAGIEHGEVIEIPAQEMAVLSLQDPDDINLELTAPLG